MKVEKLNQKGLRICRSTLGMVWGLRPFVVHWFYTIVIRLITYRTVVWWTNITVQKCKVALDKPQKTACIAITRAFRTPPVAVIDMMLGLEPLDIFIKGEAMSGMYRSFALTKVTLGV